MRACGMRWRPRRPRSAAWPRRLAGTRRALWTAGPAGRAGPRCGSRGSQPKAPAELAGACLACTICVRRVTVYPGWIAVETTDIPVPRPGEVLVRTRPLNQVTEAFELAASGQHVKVLVTVANQ
jgi:hypothetical protein